MWSLFKKMQRFRYITAKTRLLSPLLLSNSITCDRVFFVSSSSSPSPSPSPSAPSPYRSTSDPSFYPFINLSASSSTTTAPPPDLSFKLQAKDVAAYFIEWFNRQNDPHVDKVFDVLRQGGGGGGEGEGSIDDKALNSALSQLGLRLSETLVLKILKYGANRRDVLSCLKFFDWAGHQPGFYHTPCTLNAIFKILSREKLLSLILDFLENHRKDKYTHYLGFNSTLVMGYAVAGKPEVALQLFGKMRFQGLDLDRFSYHALLNALVEQHCFDAADVIAKQISLQGFESEVTHFIMMKNFCKQNQLDKAESFLLELVGSKWELNGYSLSILVDALCRKNQFAKAAQLLEEFRGMGKAAVEKAYGVWIQGLVQAGKLDEAIEFMQNAKSLEGYMPDVFRCNILIYRLLRENRLQEVFDLVLEMKERSIPPDEVTMNAILCFFCKSGMVHVALELYELRTASGFSPNSMAYNYLINTLCGDGGVDDAYRVLKNSIDQGYFPGRKTFLILADALCRQGKFDKMKELVVFALDRNFKLSDRICDVFISALCRAHRVEDGYLIHEELNRLNKVASRNTYYHLIHGFNDSNRGDIAARLLIEMQEKGHTITRKIYRVVICSLFDMENPEKQFFDLLEMQLSLSQPSCEVYNYFIEGAGHAKKPELAREVYEMMVRSGIKPNLSSDVLMLQSLLKSGKISDALNFFNDLPKRRTVGPTLSNAMVIGLCKVGKPDLALHVLGKIREKNIVPSLNCYEELVLVLCTNQKYHIVVNLLHDITKVGRHVSSFLCNVLMLHSMKNQCLYRAWIQSRSELTEKPCTVMLDQLIVSFTNWRFSEDLKDLEEHIEQLFPPDIFTFNVLLKRLTMNNMDRACELFSRLCQKGYEPNRWTYDILVRGFFKHGRRAEARKWMNEMFTRGFAPIDHTKLLI